MKAVSLYIIIIIGFLTSCYEPYFAEMDSEKKILVVEGMITNDPVPYKITLKYASPFNDNSPGESIPSAIVYVTDNSGIKHQFREFKNGIYISDSLIFRGRSGETYTLFVELPDGNVYKSNSQKLCFPYRPDSIYARVEYKESLSQYNQLIRTIKGASILADISSKVDTIPHFRFNSTLVRQYFYSMQIPPPIIDPPLYLFYCWEGDNSVSGINLTNKDYSLNSNSVKRHSIRFINDETSFYAFSFKLGDILSGNYYLGAITQSRQSYTISGRILYTDQYTLNDEAFAYYKSMDDQLSSEGKLFDPLATQLKGNMTCVTDSSRQVAGFFEASAVSHIACKIKVIGRDTYQVRNIQYVLPPQMPYGCIINKAPAFWDL